MAEGDDAAPGPPTGPTGIAPEAPPGPPTTGPPIVLSQSAVPRSGLGFATSEALARMGAPDPPSRYEIGGLLGRGGMGEVHVARDPASAATSR